MGMIKERAVAAFAALCLTLLLAACGDDTTSAATGGTTGGTVEVTLQEFAIGAEPGTIGAGEVTFDVTNVGPEDVHEFVIIRTDLAATDLPVDGDGAVDESGEGMEVIDEIEDLAVGDTEAVTVTLDAGSYALICNLVEEHEGMLEAHYSEGMRTPFTVS